ncbi:LisH domain-containing protein [Caenorhabditis elegans]|uniref:LisH domain-containing protein n=1 Tax=Caenorhabditis elegans TaxID=6239 RepID=Q18107_CAEEL|nr:LisH domain-containing protein [Caenorhabditis elegans]CCD65281.1 LisH domain-containing protein [Caenorhabditis elegans]|eukprot:NP_509577.1 Uncharacterized protein CELE_C23F12.4 [Caenorhabditis elegans]
MDEDGLEQTTPLMSLRQIKACGHLLLGTLQLRCEQHGSTEDPRKESITARVFLRKRMKELPETDDKNNKAFVLRALYKLLDANYAIVFSKIGQVSGELAFLSQIHDDPDFDSVETQFIWTCDYLFKSGQLENEWRGDFIVPSTPEFEMPMVDEMAEEEQANFMIESEMELRRQLEGYMAIEEGNNQ